MDTALHVAQVFLAVVFTITGTMKLVMPIERLALRMHWVRDFRPWQVRAIGLLELLGAIGLIVPAATGILPWLTPLAALCLALAMAFASAVNVRTKAGPAPTVSSLVVMTASAAVFVGLAASIPLA